MLDNLKKWFHRDRHYESGFKFSKRSLKSMEGLEPEMKDLCNIALAKSYQDFTIIEGLRTKEQQRENVKKGVSQTMNSYHLKGLAIDFWPVGFKGGAISEEHFKVADAFREASIKMTLDVVWGAAWSRYLCDFDSAKEALEDYKKYGGKFIDAGHIEIHNGT